MAKTLTFPEHCSRALQSSHDLGCTLRVQLRVHKPTDARNIAAAKEAFEYPGWACHPACSRKTRDLSPKP